MQAQTVKYQSEPTRVMAMLAAPPLTLPSRNQISMRGWCEADEMHSLLMAMASLPLRFSKTMIMD